MDELIEQQLWNFKVGIEPTEAQKEGAQNSHAYLRNLMNTGQIGNRIRDSYLSGSYARDTAIRPIDDVDIIFVIDPRHWQQGLYGLLSTNPSPAAVLQTFSNAIRYRYPVSSVYHQRRSVRLSLFHLDIDVVPAIALDQTATQILIPDTEKDEWIKSAPKIHADRASTVNKLRGGRFKPLVKILKKWNSNIPSTASLKSFCIETMATRIFSEVECGSLLGGMIYFLDFASRLGSQQQVYNWTSTYGMSWSILTGVTVPDVSGTGSNTAAGVDYSQQTKFAEYAARSRDRLVAAKKAMHSSTAIGHLKDALYI